MMEKILILLSNNSFIRILLIAVTLDTLLGVLRAIKEHKFNSCVGIDGAIRKAAMLFSVCLLMATDVIMHINMLGMVPEKYMGKFRDWETSDKFNVIVFILFQKYIVEGIATDGIKG